jgi:DNA polymerase-3 subunit delta'
LPSWARQARGCGAAILRQGDPTNARRSDLALELGKKGAADRYAAFLDLAPSLIAARAAPLDGAPRERALDAYAKARELAGIAPRLSLDPPRPCSRSAASSPTCAEPRFLEALAPAR